MNQSHNQKAAVQDRKIEYGDISHVHFLLWQRLEQLSSQSVIIHAKTPRVCSQVEREGEQIQ